MIATRKVCITAAICHQRTARGISKQNVIQAVSRPLATIREPRLLTDYTYRKQRIHAGAMTHHQCRAGHTPAGP